MKEDLFPFLDLVLRKTDSEVREVTVEKEEAIPQHFFPFFPSSANMKLFKASAKGQVTSLLW